jgi:serine/threonine protein kinase
VTNCGTPLWMAPEALSHGRITDSDDCSTGRSASRSAHASASGAAAGSSASASASASTATTKKYREAAGDRCPHDALAKMDVYSFGVLMWQMITRERPFDGHRNAADVIMWVLAGKRPAIPSSFPADLADMVKRCWHKNPDKRPTMNEVLVFLNGKVGGAPRV